MVSTDKTFTTITPKTNHKNPPPPDTGVSKQSYVLLWGILYLTFTYLNG